MATATQHVGLDYKGRAGVEARLRPPYGGTEFNIAKFTARESRSISTSC